MKLNVKKAFKLAIFPYIALGLVGCEITQKDPDIRPHIADELTSSVAQNAQQKNSAKMPAELTEELLSSVKSNLFAPNELDMKRFEIAANEVDVRSFFASLVDGTPYSVALHPEVEGKISLNLKDVTLDEVIKIVTRMYPLDVFRDGKVVQVLPARMRTESIAVNYLMMKRTGISTVSVVAGGVSQFGQSGSGGSANSGARGNNQNSGANGNQSSGNGNGMSNGSQMNGASIQTSSEFDFWTDLKKALESLVGVDKGRYIIVSPQASLVTVHALPSEIAAMKEFLRLSEESLQRQVILEAKIIEVTLKDDYQQGVNWKEVLGHIGSTDLTFATTASGQIGNTITAGIGGVSSLVFKNADFSGVVSLLSTQGDVQMLSNPRVTATNNQKAVIKVGQDEYFVTEVSSTTVTGNATTTTPEISLTPFFSGIALDVTPQIDKYGSVILHVHPSVTETAEQRKVITLNNEEFVLPLAQSNIRESDTVIRAGSGEIVVIGGLMQTVTTDEESKTPLLGDMPVLGHLFKSVRKRQDKKELIILIKPTVVMADTWQQQQQRSMQLLKSWYSN
ncbi:pilus (MSHA type) biogenesis protein MshL [Pseudoalteromonas tunicata]|uniref:MSHA biogenesis protein MshL n=1 Tax=Pseudoalteromonas tunicata D2 TaxID=87626 RepID=A4C7Y6_9GAMM|nr:pilus (MSHA type) biogenesis protein MshL [Pseudoalteromonas tunicata]ATC93208.1 MSHA biogenesis protein MshL [Pseudoalteromonas tunicata]AXT32271.1 pilus (MSHA type) biogenesis protein MshL [Pseudoalteromonas tunicata]EAR28701.1 MSHA biogenesis protein MshL [Pseudoalteromonas tunicata D2]MDP5212758.1 pilus (MSHA type) biogenesis protein MshL [Pseudoalteromonas tunicata]